MASWTISFLEEYQKYHPHKVRSGCRPVAHWITPPSGRLKMNINGDFCAARGCGGLGIIVRNEDGNCVAALHRSLPFISSKIHAEAEACRAGLFMALHHGWDNILLETDSSVLNAALANSEVDLSDVGHIIGDCKEHLKGFVSCIVDLIYREANGVGHRLARIASFSYVNAVWLDENPSIIEDVLYKDYCNRTRGLGITSPSVYNHSRS